MPEELTTTNNAELVHDPGPARLATQAMRCKPDINQMRLWAELMAVGSFTPAHLVWKADANKTIANCFRVVNQAVLWGMDPFSVADESYVVGGKLAYSGKLVAALVNARAGLKERLKPIYRGQGDALEVTVSGTFAKEKAAREITLSLKQARTKNDIWDRRPEQKLFYCAALEWARRHCPELVLGVSIADEMETIPTNATHVEVSTNGTGAHEIDPQEETPAVVPTMAQDPQERQTLQEALENAPVPLKGDERYPPDERCNLSLIPRLKAAFDLVFVAKGIPSDQEGMNTRRAIVSDTLKRRGVEVLIDLTNAQALEIEKNLNDIAAKIHNAKKAAEQKK